MAIRYVSFQVSEDTTVTPSVPQYAGVQGEHNATQVAFLVETDGRLVHPEYHYYIEHVDAAGGYDRTEELTRHGNQIATLLPFAWTQYGGVSTVRLVIETNGEMLYSIEGRLQFEERGTAIEKVDGLLRTDLTETLAACHDAADACRADAVVCREAAEAATATHHAMTEDIAEAQADFADAIDALPTMSTDVATDTIWSSRYMADKLCPRLEESGNPLTVHPLAGYPLQVTARHKNLLAASIPTAPTQMNGLTFTPQADGSVVVDGTATVTTDYRLVNTNGAACPLAENTIPSGTALLFSGCPAGGSVNSYSMYISATPSEPSASAPNYVREITGAPLTFATAAAEYTDTMTWRCGIRITVGTVCDHLVFSPCLERTESLTLAVVTDTLTRLYTVEPRRPLSLTLAGDETTFSLESDGTVKVLGRQDVAAFCAALERRVNDRLAALAGGDGA